MTQETGISSSSLERPRRRWFLTVLLGSVILLCGVLIGGAITSHVLWGRLLDRVRHFDKRSERIADDMQRRLDLTDEQAKEIKRIISKRNKALLAIHREVAPRVEAELEQMRIEVDSVLTPEQVERWNRRFHRMREHWIVDRPGPPLKHGRRGPPGRGKRMGGRRGHKYLVESDTSETGNQQPADSL